MTAGLDHPLVADYLRRLDDAARVLEPGRRAELVSEICSHLAERLRETDGDEAEVRNMLQRMGSPEEIVAEADDRPVGYPAGGPPPAAPRSRVWLELAAVLLMTVGSILLPVIGWLVGVVLLWMSGWLRWWEKLIATLVLPGGIGGLALIGMFSVRSCYSSSDGVDTCGATTWWDHAAPWVVGAAAVGSVLIPMVLLTVARSRSLRQPPGWS